MHSTAYITDGFTVHVWYLVPQTFCLILHHITIYKCAYVCLFVIIMHVIPAAPETSLDSAECECLKYVVDGIADFAQCITYSILCHLYLTCCYMESFLIMRQDIGLGFLDSTLVLG